ncbi:hypothetical protein Sango_0490800 [Sesamum angolense]|uniref:Uncharacterized protein n=1 Tax=Sesamum angolense TaxID=2727404 RepID=A0AAE2C4V5_9LAMI|nr:hypothetical protein Sango_0490800 [Sesamum angolense]
MNNEDGWSLEPGGHINLGSSVNGSRTLLDATLQVACSADVVGNAPSNTTSNTDGSYRVVLIPRPNATVGSIVSNCRLFVLSPLSTCNPTLPSAGLVSDLIFVRIVPSGFLRIAYLVAAVHVNGTLYCTADGSPAPHGTATPVFSNATLRVVCSNDVVFNSPSNATSNGNGVVSGGAAPTPQSQYCFKCLQLPPLCFNALVHLQPFPAISCPPAEFKKMNSLSATGFFPKYPVLHYAKRRRYCSRVPAVFSTLKASPPPLNEFAGDDVLREFLKERELSGDIVAKLSDELWLRGVVANSKNLGEFEGIADNQKFNSASQLLEEDVGQESEGGFLKLKRTSEWLLGDDNSAPMNRKMTSKPWNPRSVFHENKKSFGSEGNKIQDDIASVFSVVFVMLHGHHRDQTSDPAAVSYATGVIFSCLYFQLLCKHADNISREAVPEVFTKKKSKKIGIRSEDLQDFVERTLKGSGIALSSPRLVIPVAIYGLWELSQHFANDIFDFQLVPAMVGLFAYKAAALVQVYRDNEDLQFIFPENTDRSSLNEDEPRRSSLMKSNQMARRLLADL